MSCRTCGHTLNNIGSDNVHRKNFWCPRCGSLWVETYEPHVWHTLHKPSLVERALQLVEAVQNKETRRTENMIRTVKETCGVPLDPSAQ